MNEFELIARLTKNLPTNKAVLVGAGDIAVCGEDKDEATAKLLDSIPGTGFTAGANVYGGGTPRGFSRGFSPGGGGPKVATRPAPGSHASGARGAAG